jgi:hypothetical protein
LTNKEKRKKDKAKTDRKGRKKTLKRGEEGANASRFWLRNSLP